MLLFASESNIQGTKLCEEAFAKLKADVGVVVGSIYVSDTENDQQSSASNKIIGNPKDSRKKGERLHRRRYQTLLYQGRQGFLQGTEEMYLILRLNSIDNLSK